MRMGLAAVPVGVAVGELVELAGDFEVGPGHRRVADVVLAFVGIDVPAVLSWLVGGEGLVGVAVPAADREVADVDRVVLAHRLSC